MPFWNGILSALAAILIGVIGTFIVLIVIVAVAILVTGKTPALTNPAGPLLSGAECTIYVLGGAFAWSRLRTTGRNPFRKLTGADVRVILIGIAALIVVHIGTAVQLVLTGQTKHVQSGLEHFDVVSKVPGVTILSIALIVLSAVVLAPIVEEMIFRALLFGALAPRLGVLAGALITALIFGAIHGDAVLFPTLTALGFIAALAYAATGNLWVAITLHALNNALGAVALVAGSLHHATR